MKVIGRTGSRGQVRSLPLGLAAFAGRSVPAARAAGSNQRAGVVPAAPRALDRGSSIATEGLLHHGRFEQRGRPPLAATTQLDQAAVHVADHHRLPLACKSNSEKTKQNR